MLVQSMLCGLETLAPLRTFLDHPEEGMLVTCLSETLEEAVRHCQSCEPPLRTLPPFILPDIGQGENIPAIPPAAAQVYMREALDRVQPEKLYVYFPAHGLPGKVQNGYARLDSLLYEHGIERYCTAMPPELARNCPPLPAFPIELLLDIFTVYTALADAESRDIFLRYIKYVQTGDSGYCRVSRYAQYQHPAVAVSAGDFVIDGGLLDGHVTAAFARLTGKTGKVTGFEACPTFIRTIQEKCRPFPQVEIENAALYSKATELYLEENIDAPGGSFVQATPLERSWKVRAVALDDWLEAKQESCSLLKLDIEGAEMDCLQGAKRTLRKDRPKLQISAYHKLTDVVDIPLFILEHCPEYALFMGHHSCTGFETILYAAPAESLSSKELGCTPPCLNSNLNNRELATLEKRARDLAGQEVLFAGGGAAFAAYRNLFSASIPAAVLVDREFLPSKGAAEDPMMAFEDLPRQKRKLPMIVFARHGHRLTFMRRIARFFPERRLTDYTCCILY